MEYSAGMTSCLFWLKETRNTAELMVQGLEDAEIKRKAIEENIYQVKSRERAVRIYGVTMKRLRSLPESIIISLAKGDIATAKAIILISIMSTDKLFFEFVYEVYRQAIMLGEDTISKVAIDRFFDNKIAQSEVVAGWSESAIEKLKQCYAKILLESGALVSINPEKRIAILNISYKVREELDNNGKSLYVKTILGEN